MDERGESDSARALSKPRMDTDPTREWVSEELTGSEDAEADRAVPCALEQTAETIRRSSKCGGDAEQRASAANAA
jgi:hypothetical protein